MTNAMSKTTGDAAEKRAEKPAEKQKGKPPENPEKGEPNKAVKSIIRFGETNLDGSKKVAVALRQVKGISFAYSNAIAKVFGFENKKIGDLSESEFKTLEHMVANPSNHNIPTWFFNRRRDPDSGEDRHLLTSTLEITHKMDIDKMKKVKSYRGVRHIAGLPVRGQRTRGSFRKGKVVGVSRKARQQGRQEGKK